ncbi:MAG: HNH endonuclease [Clostridia bacterium]|nr:HNH endonuclease [Clostridia bacterium]
MIQTKVCTKCGKELPATTEYFSPLKSGKYGLRPECKECRRITPDRIPKQGYRFCSKCNEELPETEEYFRIEKNRGKFIFRGICKKCQKLINNRYYIERKEYYKEYREHNKSKHQQYYNDNRDKILLQNCKYYLNNSETLKQKKKVYYLKNRDYINEKNKENYKKNLEQRKAYDKYRNIRDKAKRRINHQKYLARKKDLEATLTKQQWAQILKEFNNQCAYCGTSAEEHLQAHSRNMEQEHFIPLSKGGEYTHNNIIPACRSCNSSKNNKDFFEWYPEQEFYSKEREQKILKHLGYKQEKQQLRMAL